MHGSGRGVLIAPRTMSVYAAPYPRPTNSITDLSGDAVYSQTPSHRCARCDSLPDSAHDQDGGRPMPTAVEQVIIIVKENHCFENYFASKSSTTS